MWRPLQLCGPRLRPAPSSFLSQLVEDVLDQLTQVFVYVAAVRVEALGNVLQCLKEAVEVHLGVLAPLHYILVDDVVMGFSDVRVRH